VSAASRSVLLLHYEEELTLREIAEALGVSIGTVKSRLAYGIAALRTRWAD
jgi:RNA polymerase sigma factor (sigma-70 family)